MKTWPGAALGSVLLPLTLESSDMNHLLFPLLTSPLSLRCLHHREQGVCEVSLTEPQIR